MGEEEAGGAAASLVPSQALTGSNNMNSNNSYRNRRRKKNPNQKNDQKRGEQPSRFDNDNNSNKNTGNTSGDMNADETTSAASKNANSDNRRNRNRGRNRNKKATPNEEGKSDGGAVPDGQPKHGDNEKKQQQANKKERSNSKNSKNMRNNSRRKKKRGKNYPWRKEIPHGAVDPITLDPLASLHYPPFALCAEAPYDPVPLWPVPMHAEKEKEETSRDDQEERAKKILEDQWGSKALSVNADNANNEEENERVTSPKTRHYNLFDGRALAYYMVSQLQFIDPLNRRDLTRDELVELDRYLRRNGFEGNVVEAYDTKGVTISQAGAAAATASGRAEMLQQQAQLLLNALFGASTVGGGAQTSVTLAQQYEASVMRDNTPGNGSQRRNNRRQQHHQHHQQAQPDFGDSGIYGDNDGGLIIIDDDVNPGLRGGLNSVASPPDGANMSADAPPFTPGSLWSASHIRDQYSHSSSVQAANFPALAPAAATGVAAAAAAAAVPAGGAPRKAQSRSLTRMTKLVSKTDPREVERQREAREVFVRRAMMSNLNYGIDRNPGDQPSGLLSVASGGTTPQGPSEGQLLRNRAFADALGVVPSTVRMQQASLNSGWARPVDVRAEIDQFGNELNATIYPDSLIRSARERMQLTLRLEKKWKTFLADDTSASLPLNKMDRPTRVFVHEYSDYWKLHTESFDPEPNRYIHCVKMADTSAPRPLLSDAARNWSGPRPVVESQTDHAVKQTAGQTPREFPPPPERQPLALRPRSSSIPPGFDSGNEFKQRVAANGAGGGGAINTRSDSLFVGRERPKLELTPRTLPLELPPSEPKLNLVEESKRQEAIRKEREAARQKEEERKRRILLAAFDSDDEEASLKSHDSDEWDGLDDEALYSGSDEEEGGD